MTESNIPANAPAQTADPAATLANAQVQLIRALKSSASWFYWIAGLSVVNTLLTMFNTDRSFIVGLGSTQLIDGISEYLTEGAGSEAAVLRIVAIVLDLLIIGIFVLFGFKSSQGRRWAFVIGMILYALDGLLFFLVTDWFSIAFHLFVLWRLYSGIQALGKLNKLKELVTNFNPA